MSAKSPAAKGPTVQARPTFRRGDQIECPNTGEIFTVEQVLKNGDYICRGRAGAMPAALARRPLTAEEKAELAG